MTDWIPLIGGGEIGGGGGGGGGGEARKWGKMGNCIYAEYVVQLQPIYNVASFPGLPFSGAKIVTGSLGMRLHC